MKTYTFETKLTQEQIFARLSIYASRGYSYTAYKTDAFLYERIDTDKFFLIKTPTIQVSGQAPFQACIVTKPDGVRIVGKFRPLSKNLRIIIPFTLIPAIPFLCLGNPIAAISYFIWVGMVFALFYELLPRCWRKQHNAVLKFIEQYLLY